MLGRVAQAGTLRKTEARSHGPDHEHDFIQIYLDFISFYMILFHFIIIDISLSPVYSIYDDYIHVPHYVTIATALICNTGDVMLTSFA